MDEMKNQVALITGASSGIGKACAFKFASEGARVALVARNADKLNEVVSAIQAQGGAAHAISADVTKESDIERVVRETIAAFGAIDVVVNAAGILASGNIENTKLQDWDYMMNVNVRAPFYLIQRAMPHLIERKGNVVNVSSVTGIRAFPNVLAYCASKAALDQLTHCVALEVASKGVRVNAVDPGVTVTQLHRTGGMKEDAYAKFLEHSKTTHPLGRVGTPDEVADLIFFLASPRAGWITGISCPIDGGRSQTCLR
ncbi:meso-butanediol dehydrogenase / (S,S)-butanediol dehydrogenase / diacetyl reductase [Anaerolineae bacterium]|nr:meso-butanediol dehydrogenase / (S,S)-butanediol dehydrogenase / diacetyl reductase [Anaerolineae bacterium]